MKKKDHKEDNISILSQVLADTYLIYLKTQNYHWNVEGPTFFMLHGFFEGQYNELFLAIDEIAEKIRVLGSKSPGTFTEFQKLSQIKDGDSSKTANEMVKDLHDDHEMMIVFLRQSIKSISGDSDEGIVDLLTKRLEAHEKMAWMLKSTIKK